MLKDANDRLALMQKLQRDTIPGQFAVSPKQGGFGV